MSVNCTGNCRWSAAHSWIALDAVELAIALVNARKLIGQHTNESATNVLLESLSLRPRNNHNALQYHNNNIIERLILHCEKNRSKAEQYHWILNICIVCRFYEEGDVRLVLELQATSSCNWREELVSV